jgi:hypothetical protein
MGQCLSSLRLRRRETATTSQTGAPPPPRPTLLGIDAAIRARIYEYSIVNDETHVREAAGAEPPTGSRQSLPAAERGSAAALLQRQRLRSCGAAIMDQEIHRMARPRA